MVTKFPRTVVPRTVEVTKFPRTKQIGGHDVHEPDVIQLQINLKKPLSVSPGQFIYLRIRDFYLSEKFQSHPFLICWWESHHIDKDGKKMVFDNSEMWNVDPESPMQPDIQDPHKKALSITLLLQPVSGITRRLANRETIKSVSFDGPFGQQLHLEYYDNVILVAKGIGLAGILSYAKQLLAWRYSVYKQGIITRKLDIHWEMDDLTQNRWGDPFLRSLRLIEEKAQERARPKEQKGPLEPDSEEPKTEVVSSRRGLLQTKCYHSTSSTNEIYSTDDGYLEYINFKGDPEAAIGSVVTSVIENSVGRSIVVGK